MTKDEVFAAMTEDQQHEFEENLNRKQLSVEAQVQRVKELHVTLEPEEKPFLPDLLRAGGFDVARSEKVDGIVVRMKAEIDV